MHLTGLLFTFPAAGAVKRPGRPPKWPERGEPAARDAAAAMLPGDFTRVEQVGRHSPCKGSVDDNPVGSIVYGFMAP